MRHDLSYHEVPWVEMTRKDPTSEQIEMNTIGCFSPYIGVTL